MTPNDFLVAVILIVGVITMLLSAVGLLRFRDVYMRMHAGTKASSLGIGLIILGAMVHFEDSLITVKLLALFGLYFFTSPIGAQVLAHATHIAHFPGSEKLTIDELTEYEHEHEHDGDTDPHQPTGELNDTSPDPSPSQKQ